MHNAIRILKNTIALIMSTGIERVVSFVLTLYIARALGVTALGEFGLVLSLSSIFSTIALVGQDQIIIREVGRDKSQALYYLCNSGLIAVAGGILGMVIMTITAYGLGYEPRVVGYAAIMSLSLIPGTLVMVGESLIQGLERMEFVTLVRFGGNLFKVGASIGLLVAGFGLGAVFASIVATQAIMFGLYLVFIVRLSGKLAWLPDKKFMRSLLGISGIFAAITIFNVAFRSIDVVFLTSMRGMEEGGVYVAASKTVQTVQILLPALMLSVYPVLSQTFLSDPERFATTAQRTLKLLFSLIIPLVFLLTILAPQLVILLYKEDFSSSIPVFQVLVWLLIPLAGNAVLFRTIYASNNERVTLRIVGVNMTVNIALNLLLIPRFGALGTSIAALCSILGGFIQNLWFVHKHLFSINLVQLAGRPVLAAAAAGVLVWLLRDWSLIPLLGIGLAAYALFLVGLGGVSKDELALFQFTWQALRQELQKRIS
jgi:O-antigen/teichoic acid export membrane protein